MGKEFLKYGVENITWRYMNEKHGKAIAFFQSPRKGPFWRKGTYNMVVALHTCSVTGSLLCKGRTGKELGGRDHPNLDILTLFPNLKDHVQLRFVVQKSPVF